MFILPLFQAVQISAEVVSISVKPFHTILLTPKQVVTGTPILSVYAGEIQAKGLGMKVEVFDPSGNNVEQTGQPGELVCTRPHPSLPVSFWGDESGKKLREAYFGVYPGKQDVFFC